MKTAAAAVALFFVATAQTLADSTYRLDGHVSTIGTVGSVLGPIHLNDPFVAYLTFDPVAFLSVFDNPIEIPMTLSIDGLTFSGTRENEILGTVHYSPPNLHIPPGWSSNAINTVLSFSGGNNIDNGLPGVLLFTSAELHFDNVNVGTHVFTPEGTFDSLPDVSSGITMQMVVTSTTVVPEPSSFALAACGIAGLVGRRLRRRRIAILGLTKKFGCLMICTISIVTLLMSGFCAISQALTIDVGHHFLQPNTNGGPLNSFPVIISGNRSGIMGGTLNVQVGNGGPLGGGLLIGPGPNGQTGPSVSTGNGPPGPTANYPGWGGVGYLFATNNTGISDTNYPTGANFGGQILSQGTTTLGSFNVSVIGSATWVMLSFDTTGFTSGTWDLLLQGGNAGDSSIGTNSGSPILEVTNGSITIVPEPNGLLLSGIAIVGLIAWQRRRKR